MSNVNMMAAMDIPKAARPMVPVRRDSTHMESMTPTRISVLGPLTRSEEILQFERFRHQIHIVESLRGLKISHSNPSSPQSSYPPQPWSQLRDIDFADLVMDSAQDGCVIKCRTVVEPLLFGSLQMLVEEIDGGFKVMMLSIENYVDEWNIRELGALFPVGREIWIRGPCVKSHEGRPMIRVDDPTNLKLRQTSREIERILEYGPVDVKGWRTKGNTLVKRGRVDEALEAYNTGITYAGGDPKLRASLFRKRATTFFDVGKFQAARREAMASLSIEQNDKILFLLAKILLELRSYSSALYYIQQLSVQTDSTRSLLRQLSTCVMENQSGNYSAMTLAEEAQRDDRLIHADYVSPNIGLRAEGVAGRGLFATEKLIAGTLLIASKAILCVFVDEIPAQIMSNAEEEGKGLFDSIRDEFIDRLAQMVGNGSARRLLQLAGGSQSGDANIDIRRDDVYDDDHVYVQADEIRRVVTKNSFGGAQRSRLLAHAAADSEQQHVGGGAVFFAPSFINHSCVPNATYYTIGDMMFIRANRDIENGEELTIHYLYVEESNEKERNETLERVWEFTCHCELCEYERANEETCSSADSILKKALMFVKTGSTDDSIKKLVSARKKLYQLYRHPVPQIDLLSSLETPPPIPVPALARNLMVLFRGISVLLRQSTRSKELSGSMNAEYQFLYRSYSHYERIGAAGLPALRVWEYLYKNPTSSASEAADAWLQEARESHDMLLGDGHFEYQHGSFMKGVKSA
jgi:hypothetical protein